MFLPAAVSSAQESAVLEGRRRGLVPGQPFLPLTLVDGIPTLRAQELDLLQVRVRGGGTLRGYERVGASLRPLPVGSSITGDTFAWQLGPGFLGVFDVLLVADTPLGVVRQDVRILVHPLGTFSRAQLIVDTPGAQASVGGGTLIAGWTLDPRATIGPGIAAVHVWAYPADGGAPVFLGAATLGGNRPDVAAMFGTQFEASGFELIAPPMPAGDYTLALFPYSQVTGGFLPATTLAVTAR